MNRKDCDRVKKRLQKIEKLTADYNERIAKELSDITHVLDSHTTKEESTVKTKRRSTSRRSSKDHHADGGLLSEED